MWTEFVGASSIDAHMDEALLLDETEELLNCLEPTAFVVESPKTTPTATRWVAVFPTAPPLSPLSPTAAPSSTQKRRGRRSWKSSAMRNPSRERLQFELAALRQQASALENELSLARRHERALAQNQRLVLPKWEAVAKRQRTARHTTESENQRLRALVDSQRGFVTQLQHAWHRWQRIALPHPRSAVASVMVRFTENDPAIFAMLAASIDLEYLRMRDVFASAGLLHCGLAPSSRQAMRTRIFPSGDAVPVLELAIVDVAPYDHRLIAQASWQCVQRQGTMRNRVRFTELPGATAACDTLSAVKMRSWSVRNNNQRGVLIEELNVTKRFVAPDHTAYVWRSTTREEAGENADDMFIDETGWVMIQDAAAFAPAAGLRGSVTVTCLQLEPKRLRGATLVAREAATRDPFADVVLETFQSDMEYINASIYELLLEAGDVDAVGNPT